MLVAMIALLSPLHVFAEALVTLSPSMQLKAGQVTKIQWNERAAKSAEFMNLYLMEMSEHGNKLIAVVGENIPTKMNELDWRVPHGLSVKNAFVQLVAVDKNGNEAKAYSKGIVLVADADTKGTAIKAEQFTTTTATSISMTTETSSTSTITSFTTSTSTSTFSASATHFQSTSVLMSILLLILLGFMI